MALTHFDSKGRAVMVDVSDKAETERLAVARGRITMRSATLKLILAKGVKKGDVLTIAQLAGIAGAKRTPDLVPLCHPLALTSVKVELTPVRGKPAIDIEARVKTTGRTGVEMEALTAVTVAALTVYDMCKAVDRDMVLSDIRLEHKSGGKSGVYDRVAPQNRSRKPKASPRKRGPMSTPRA
jgi:cyclic pyranopterin phosphate synthase